jgi:hypothetical protein
MRAQGQTAWVSFKHASPDLSRVTFLTRERLLAADSDGNTDVYQAGIADTGGYRRPRAATPLRVPLVPAFAPCSDPNTRHAAPLAFDACNPPRALSEHLTVGTPGANGEAPHSVGHMRIGVTVGDPSFAWQGVFVP